MARSRLNGIRVSDDPVEVARLRRTRVAAIFLAGLAASAPALAGPLRPSDGGSSSRRTIEARPMLDVAIVAQLNRIRVSRGLRPLRVNAALTAAAALHCREMDAAGVFQHESPDGTAFWKRVQRYYGSAGYKNWSVGETLLWYSPGTTAANAVADWLASPPHRKILLDPAWLEVGVSAVHDTAAPGAFEGLTATIVTADFGARFRPRG
jgi:uncharacterized protein YkwD